MLSKKSKIMLSRLLKLVAETITKQGVLYTDGDLIAGQECYIYSDGDELVLAPAGEYEGETAKYTIGENGILEKVEEYSNVETTETEEPEKTETEMEEEASTGEEEKEETPAEGEQEQSVEDLKKIIEDKDQEIADLRKQIEEIKSANKEVIDEKDKQISDLEHTLSEYKERVEKPSTKSIEETEEEFQQQHKPSLLEVIKSKSKK